ncbi:MAG: murein biosynthesis integral membrane protein MurJ [Kouleothrix sp.]|jgi:putative peptidoglycan lipid II flippase|nr:murein biosynthesis integral membrane protein MurJ [Kouleothrix sp.]
MTSTTPPAPARARFGPLLNTLIVAGGYLLSRLLGLVRDIIISSQFGTQAEYGAYRATFNLIDLIYIVVAGGALGSAFIPVFSGMLAERREHEAWRLASGLLNLASIGLIAAGLLIGLLAEPIVAATIGSGFAPAQRTLTVQLLRLMLVQPVLLGLGGLAKATLESFDRFALPAIGANLYNLGIIGGALLAPWLGIYGLVWGVVAGAALFLLIQLPGLLSVGARYSPVLGRGIPGLRQVGTLLAPRLFGQAAWQINLIAIASFASLFGAEAVAANGYALTLMLLPHGLIALSLGTVIFPQLARLHAAGNQAAFRATTLNALRSVLFLALPAAALLAALAAPIVRVLFERGKFSAESTALTAQVLVFYAFGLAAFAAAEIVVRSFYAMRDTRTPVLVGAAMVLANIGLGWAFIRAGMGLPGLALAFSIANTAEAGTLLLLLERRLGRLGGAFWRALAGMLLAALLAAAVLLLARGQLPMLAPGRPYSWRSEILPLGLWLAAAAGLAGLVYGGTAWLLGLPEARGALVRARRVLRRRADA